MNYEGSSLAYHATPEIVVIKEDEIKRLNNTLRILTESQYRRLLMKAYGLSYRAITEIENTFVKAIQDSIMQAKKKIIENL